MTRIIMLTAAIAVALPTPASAQGLLGGILGNATRSQPQSQSASDGCKGMSAKKKQGSAIAGSILGGIASSTVGRTGINNFVPLNTLTTMLVDAIACKLDADEQKKAAAATNDALQRGTAGTSVAWTSTTRPNVTGTSTIKAKTQVAGGGTCMDVNDVIIVEGEETTVSKRMCKIPPASGYSIQKA